MDKLLDRGNPYVIARSFRRPSKPRVSTDRSDEEHGMVDDQQFDQLPLVLDGRQAEQGVGFGGPEEGRCEDDGEVLGVHHVLLLVFGHSVVNECEFVD